MLSLSRRCYLYLGYLYLMPSLSQDGRKLVRVFYLMFFILLVACVFKYVSSQKIVLKYLNNTLHVNDDSYLTWNINNIVLIPFLLSSIPYQPGSRVMTTYKVHIEKLGSDIQDVKDSLQKLSTRSETRFQELEHFLTLSIERSMQKILDSSSKTKGETSKNFNTKVRGSNSHSRHGHHRDNRDEGPYTRPLKMDFPQFSGDEPIIWLKHVAQIFEFQQTVEGVKVNLAAFYLEGEVNQWWQWLKIFYLKDAKPVTWANLEQARYGPTDYEDFDEALSCITQKGHGERIPKRIQASC